ncbi:protein of unknown function [Paraburkholderia dioscoreae]|uniref:Uncharacterized protein n=1 Tax=Paraburkholderia dioscoreae TaxID=2604047 RepID=A0A5Q4ZN08_9BURK|nr:protein of unknown function [Paraburkholderia dioscoreae]
MVSIRSRFSRLSRRPCRLHALLPRQLLGLRRRLNLVVLERGRRLQGVFGGAGQIEIPLADIQRSDGYRNVVRGHAEETTGGDDCGGQRAIGRNHQIADRTDLLVLVVVHPLAKNALLDTPAAQQRIRLLDGDAQRLRAGDLRLRTQAGCSYCDDNNKFAQSHIVHSVFKDLTGAWPAPKGIAAARSYRLRRATASSAAGGRMRTT